MVKTSRDIYFGLFFRADIAGCWGTVRTMGPISPGRRRSTDFMGEEVDHQSDSGSPPSQVDVYQKVN